MNRGIGTLMIGTAVVAAAGVVKDALHEATYDTASMLGEGLYERAFGVPPPVPPEQSWVEWLCCGCCSRRRRRRRYQRDD